MQNSQVLSLCLHFHARCSGISFLIILSLHFPSGQGTSKNGHTFRWSWRQRGGTGRVYNTYCTIGPTARWNRNGVCAHRYLLQTHLLLTAVSFTPTEDLQRHNLSMATYVSKYLKAIKKIFFKRQALRNPLLISWSWWHDSAEPGFSAHLVFEQGLPVSRTHWVWVTAGRERTTLNPTGTGREAGGGGVDPQLSVCLMNQSSSMSTKWPKDVGLKGQCSCFSGT